MVKGLILCALLALASCTTAKGSFCAIESPIRLAPAAVAALSDAEVKTILSHNRTGQKLCGWAP